MLNRVFRASVMGLLTLASLSLTACNDRIDVVNQYAESVVPLKVGAGGVATGRLEFVHRRYFPSTRTECDQVVCGYDTTTSWEQVQNCSNVPSCGTRQYCRYEDNDHDGHGHYRCDDVRDCDYRESCTYESRPVTRTEPRYCDTNCRQVPFEDVDTKAFPSAITAKIEGLRPGDERAIRNLVLAVHTNDKFREAIVNPAARPKTFGELFNTLKREHDTILLLTAKGYRLVPGQAFLKLPSNFKRGDRVTLTIRVEPVGGKLIGSVVGTTQKFPVLATKSHD